MVEGKSIAIAIVLIIVVIFSLLGVSGIFGGITVSGDNQELSCNLPGAVCAVGGAIGFPSGWLRTDTFIWYAFIPLLGIAMIIFGFLDRIKIFRGSINGVLATLIAFSMIPLGIFVLIVAFIFGILGIYSVALFVGLFIAGTYLYSRGLITGWRAVYGAYDRAIAAQNNLATKIGIDLRDVDRRLRDARAVPPRNEYARMGAAEIADEVEDLIARQMKLKKQIHAAHAKRKYLIAQKKSGKRVAQALEQT